MGTQIGSLEETDFTTGNGKIDIIGVSLDKIEVKVPKALELLVELNQWEKMGLKLSFSLRERVTYENIVQWFHNEDPYINREEALNEYEKVRNAIKDGKYKIEYTLNRKPKLIFLD